MNRVDVAEIIVEANLELGQLSGFRSYIYLTVKGRTQYLELS